MDKKDADKADAAEKLTDAVRVSYEAAVESAAAMQSRNTRLARGLYEGSIEAQAEFSRHTRESLAGLALEHQEAFLWLCRESLDAYDGFLDSLYTYYEEVSKEPKELEDR